ncbi:SLC13 family permease [Eubacterium sp.]|uniref:SLC13 family permease n=1 Tax=Eubacterium sp. TaxID=142586 RepID=UPI0025D4E482|nr:SLC13 family permease [Eubacterium sp.]MCR5630315.1 anion permease [Eubacterium sp.]
MTKLKIKIDPILCIAIILAIISSFFVFPDAKYIKYIDYRTLGILWSLMVIIKGLEDNMLFEKIAKFLLNKSNRLWQLIAILIFTVYVSAMFITNDVALITFVPFTIMVLRKCKKDNLILIVIIFETIAANMGSMLTPIGNPQNLYIYGVSKMSLVDFLSLMLPYSLLTIVLLCISQLFLPGKMDVVDIADEHNKHIVIESKKQVLVYCLLFICALLTVLRIIPCRYTVVAVCAVALWIDYKLVFRVDYALLFTFIAFFIFSGNISRIPEVHDKLAQIIKGREFVTSIALSQIISNVPATLLITGFTHRYKTVILGADLGGLGTLIASMASVISYKIYAREKDSKKFKYIISFTAISIVYLSVLLSYAFLVEHRKVERNIHKKQVKKVVEVELDTREFNDEHRIMTLFVPGLEKHSLEGALSSLDGYGFYNVKVKDKEGNVLEIDFPKLRKSKYKITKEYDSSGKFADKVFFVESQSIPENVRAGTDFEIVLTVKE